MRFLSKFLFFGLGFGLALGSALVSTEARAHDLRLPVDELLRGVGRIEKTLSYLRTVPAIPPLPETPDDQRRVLGAAEIELALGHKKRALEMLMGRLADPKFQALPEYVETLLFTSEILEASDEADGAMEYAEVALQRGGTPDQMAEAGARWFRLARRHQRLDRRLEMYELWKSRGGDKASGTDVAAQVMYEVAWALRADQRRRDARVLLARVPSESSVGSRAAYLAGVIFVEEGDLTNAERWFSAVMDWSLPALADDHPQMQIEKQMRELAALSAARLRYERGDHDAAEEAYAMIPEGSREQAQVCWERAFLALDRKVRRGALMRVQCVLDLGAGGSHHVDARLFRASLLAHMSRYSDSIEAYSILQAEVQHEVNLFELGATQIAKPAEFLFAGMERTALIRGNRATPGPATLFGDAWTPLVDQAYRIHRGEREADGDVFAMTREIDQLTTLLERVDAFVALDVRRGHLERLLREIQHLLGHAGDLQDATRAFHASLGPIADVSSKEDHRDDAAVLTSAIKALNRLLAEVEADMRAIDRIERERRNQALTMLKEIRGELAAIMKEARAIAKEADGSSNAVALEAIKAVRAALQNAAMRAEVGVLDTYWLKKEHRTEEIDELLRRKKEAEDEADAAMRGAEEEQREEDEADGLFE